MGCILSLSLMGWGGGGGVESIHIFKLVKAAEKKLGEQIYEVYIGVSGVVKVKSCCCCLSCIHL